jgi:hypothetical protein
VVRVEGADTVSSVMYNFLEKYPVQECSRLLDRILPVEVVSLIKFFPVADISSKKNTITVVYIVNPKSRFRGKAKTRVEIDRTSSTLRLLAKGDISFEVRFNCTNDILTIYFVVTGKLIDMVPRDKAKGIFDEIVNYVRMKAYEIGALKSEEVPTPPAPSPPTEIETIQTPQPLLSEPAAEAGTEQSPQPEPLPPTAPLEHEQEQPEVTLQQATPPPPPPEEAAAKPLQEEAAAPETSVTECVARLITAGLPVDEELSRKVPFEYSPKLSLSILVEMGEAPAGKLDLSKYTDGYLVRLASKGAKLDSLRLGGKVGVYLRVNGSQYLGSEAVWKAIDIYCGEPERKIFYIVVRV